MNRLLKRQAKPQTTLSLVAVCVLAILITLGFVMRPQPDPFQGAAVVDPPFVPLTYSIQTFLWWDTNHAGYQLDLTHRILNLTHIKQTFAWRDLELVPGEWDFSHADRLLNQAEERGLRVIARLGQVPDWAAVSVVRDDNAEQFDTPPADLEEWGNYCGVIAERYQGRIVAYQIWNEPNLSREWGDQQPDANAYVELLATCSAAIRAVDTEAILISAGLAPTGQHNETAQPDDIYLDAMYRANFQQYVDVVGVHAPGYGKPPSYGPDDAAADGRHRSTSFRRVEDLRKIMIAHGDAARQMAILEFGWTTDTVNEIYRWHAVDEETQRQYIVDAYAYAATHWRPWIGLMSLIYMPKSDWTPNDEEWWWAVVQPDGRLRPAFYGLVGMDRYCGDRTLAGWPRGWSEERYLEQRDTCP